MRQEIRPLQRSFLLFFGETWFPNRNPACSTSYIAGETVYMGPRAKEWMSQNDEQGCAWSRAIQIVITLVCAIAFNRFWRVPGVRRLHPETGCGSARGYSLISSPSRRSRVYRLKRSISVVACRGVPWVGFRPDGPVTHTLSIWWQTHWRPTVELGGESQGRWLPSHTRPAQVIPVTSMWALRAIFRQLSRTSWACTWNASEDFKKMNVVQSLPSANPPAAGHH